MLAGTNFEQSAVFLAKLSVAINGGRSRGQARTQRVDLVFGFEFPLARGVGRSVYAHGILVLQISFEFTPWGSDTHQAFLEAHAAPDIGLQLAPRLEACSARPCR